MQASGVYNRYMNVMYTSEEEQQVVSVPKQVPGAPKKAEKTRSMPAPADLQPHRLEFLVCPHAPKKVKKTREFPVNLQPQCIDFTTAFICPGAPKKVKKTRSLRDRENIVPVQLWCIHRACPAAPRKSVKAIARTPLAWTQFTKADVAWYNTYI